jgi:probable lipoprotein NlpC
MNKSVRIISVLLVVVSFLSDGCGLFKPRSTDENGNTIKKNTKFDNKSVRDIINTARDYTGTPYKYGGTTRSGMDCSGLVTVAFNSDLHQGDLVFFITGKEDKISHVGIVTDVKSKNEIYFIHAADSGVKEDNLFTKYYQKTFTKAMRPF